MMARIRDNLDPRKRIRLILGMDFLAYNDMVYLALSRGAVFEMFQPPSP